ncbi:hypothetical protein M0R45_030222 [Rubus argutus]|uniref:Phorbol-ester/DAG-type domain-containing protein n=1 Tax=Rubus argutus TaxID=59490 RepID=A0AAW1WCC9_RUBAR
MDQLDQGSIPFRYVYHPLKLKEEAHKENEDGAASSAGGPFLCAACGDPVLGSSYTCDRCKPKNENSEFIFHDKCAELPVILNHPIHGKHPLILLAMNYYHCYVCGKPRTNFLAYRCRECDFHVDIPCASNLSNVKYAEHFSHKHILIFREEQEKENAVFCAGCREPVVGPSYSCRRPTCSYTLHKSCVELPLEMKHRVHTEHLLMLSRDTKREFLCDACNQDCSRRFTYSCFQCDFNLDLKCANSDQNALKKHDTHDHALMFKEDQEEEYIGPLVVCDGCQDPVHGPHYTCINTYRRRKCGFNLHKSCAERPLEIHHPMHRQHPLSLLNVIQDIRVRCICNACNQLCRFRYSCSICDFNLDLKCASNWQNIIGSDSHKHQFTVLPRKEVDLNCDVCGEYWSGSVYYMCSICQLLVHKECASLPRHITIPGHQHRLKLTWFVEDIYPNKDQFCKVCSTNIDKCGAIYYCHECCGYVAHTACAMVDYFREKENSDTSYDVVIDEAEKIEHFSHKHPLVQISHHRQVVKDDDRIITCEGCIRPITTTTTFFYGCTETCHFFLHKVC